MEHEKINRITLKEQNNKLIRKTTNFFESWKMYESFGKWYLK